MNKRIKNKYMLLISIICNIVLLFAISNPIIAEKNYKKEVISYLGDGLVFELDDLLLKHRDFMWTDNSISYIYSCIPNDLQFDDCELLKSGWLKTSGEIEQDNFFTWQSDSINGIIGYETIISNSDNYYICYDIKNCTYAQTYEATNEALEGDYWLAVYSPKYNLFAFYFED